MEEMFSGMELMLAMEAGDRKEKEMKNNNKLKKALDLTSAGDGSTLAQVGLARNGGAAARRKINDIHLGRYNGGMLVLSDIKVFRNN